MCESNQFSRPLENFADWWRLEERLLSRGLFIAVNVAMRLSFSEVFS